MADEWSSDPDFLLWWLIVRIERTIGRMRRKELSQEGITIRQAGVLLVVHAIGDKATQSEISRWLCREPNSVSSLLKRMEKQKLIRKSYDPENMNRVVVQVTNRGQEIYEYVAKGISIHRIMSGFSEEEKKQLSTSLGKLYKRALEEGGLGMGPPWPFIR